jgi:D-alanine-D-alanine ligase
MTARPRVAVLFGGKSAEHEISLQSAANVIRAIDKSGYDVVPIGIDKAGRWHLAEVPPALLSGNGPDAIAVDERSEAVALVPGERHARLISLERGQPVGQIDVVFPVLHGPFGEDGTVQGLLKLAALPFVGAGVLGSAVGMDKDVMKRLLRDAGVPIAGYAVIDATPSGTGRFHEFGKGLGLPLFIKPANLGSSVGVSKVRTEQEFNRAVETAFQYDTKVLVEEFVEGREIECSVLGNDDPIASVPGEIVPRADFYSYEAKYIDENGAALIVPADLSSEAAAAVRELAVRAFKAACCAGMARVDLFMKTDGSLVVNELNTIPGFTRISMYPRLWEASGISCTQLIDRLIRLAIERFEKESRLKSTFE